MSKPTLPQASQLVSAILSNHEVLSHPECPFSYHSQPGNPGIVVITGDNASGKSLLLNALGARAYYDHGVEPIIISMSARTQGGVFRAMTYGSENNRATGEVSVGTALRALGAMAGRLEGGGRTLVVLDEPDFGLSESYSHAFGVRIGEILEALPQDGRWSLLLATHSRELVRGLMDGTKQHPTFIHTAEPLTLNQWLNSLQRKDTVALDTMLERAKQQSKAMRGITNAQQEQRKKPGGP